MGILDARAVVNCRFLSLFKSAYSIESTVTGYLLTWVMPLKILSHLRNRYRYPKKLVQSECKKYYSPPPPLFFSSFTCDMFVNDFIEI